MEEETVCAKMWPCVNGDGKPFVQNVCGFPTQHFYWNICGCFSPNIARKLPQQGGNLVGLPNLSRSIPIIGRTYLDNKHDTLLIMAIPIARIDRPFR